MIVDLASGGLLVTLKVNLRAQSLDPYLDLLQKMS